MNRVRAIGAAEISDLLEADLLEAAMESCPAAMEHRPYVYRDPSRVDGERMAVLKAIDLSWCLHCRAHGWPCDDHVPRASLGLAR